jgi:membrane protein YdbS with pleckstrin-like domain
MRLSKEKRKFVAENAAEAAKYILSIVILGQIISASINWWLVIGSGLVFVVLVVFAVLIYPNE